MFVKRSRVFVALIVFLMLLLAGCLQGAKVQPTEIAAPTTQPPVMTEAPVAGYANPTALVDADWLENHLVDPNVRIIDLSSLKLEYDVGHIKGAKFLDWRKDITDPSDNESYNLAPKEVVEKMLGDLGVKKDTTIVLYDNLNNRPSIWMFWTLRYYGHKDVRILNGGRKAWEKAGKGYTTETTDVTKTRYIIETVNTKIGTDASYIKSNLGNPGVVLIDARPIEMYTGEKPGLIFHTRMPHLRLGHIPGAVNVPWADNENEDMTFKSAAELKALYDSKDISKDKIIVAYCNEGLHAALTWFVLEELLGYGNVRVYDDSMAEWANDFSLPIITGSEPGTVQAASTGARVEMRNSQGAIVGTGTLSETDVGVNIALQVSNLPPGTHGIHIHAVGKCEPPNFTTAGGHFNPFGKKHGALNPEGQHAGDLPNLISSADGTAKYDTLALTATLMRSQVSLFQTNGTALIIHAAPDDEKTDPTGNSGARIACGVITQ